MAFSLPARTRRLAASTILALARGGCAALGIGRPTRAVTPSGEAGMVGPIELGDYANETEGKILSGFSKAIAARYAPSLAMARALRDLESNKFTCAAPGKAGGDPPDQVCRRTIKAGECSYTWQVHLFDDDGGKPSIARVRGLFDKTCGKEDLLGGG